MRKKLTLTIDPEVYDLIKELPRKVSISELVSWALKGVFEDIKKGRVLTQEEFDVWIRKTPEGRDFKERAREHLGPKIRKMDASIEKVKKTIKPKKTKK